MISTTYSVLGMSCEHCVQAVTAELQELSGVRSVEVDLSDGNVTVTSDAPLDAAAVAEAIDEAGYELAEPAVRS
jgi:copper ion binding protein